MDTGATNEGRANNPTGGEGKLKTTGNKGGWGKTLHTAGEHKHTDKKKKTNMVLMLVLDLIFRLQEEKSRERCINVVDVLIC